jgi:hypothetical protein
LSFTTQISDYDDWPFKIVYATEGLEANTILGHVHAYYLEHPEVPIARKPHIIHVAGRYVIFRIVSGMKIRNVSAGTDEEPAIGTFRLITRDADLHGIVWVLHGLQQNAAGSADILFSYGDLINRVHGVT